MTDKEINDFLLKCVKDLEIVKNGLTIITKNRQFELVPYVTTLDLGRDAATIHVTTIKAKK